MSYITKKTTTDGIKPIGSNLFGTCSSASSTATKTVVMPDFNVLVEGVTIHIQFTNANTAENPTLKVGSTSAVAIQRNGNLEGVWESGSVISFTYNGTCWVQNDADVSGDSGKTYTFSIDGHTLTIEDSDGDTQTLTLPDDDTKYGLSINGNVVSLVPNGSGSQITLPNDDTTYTMSISGHTLTLTPSEGTVQSITLPDDNTTYTLSADGDQITLIGSDGTTSSVTDSDTTYSDFVGATDSADGENGLVPAPKTNTVGLLKRIFLSATGAWRSIRPTYSRGETTISIGIQTADEDGGNTTSASVSINPATTSLAGIMTAADKTKLNGIEANAEVNVQADWNETDTASDAYIKNKPTIPSAVQPTTTTPLMDGTADVGSEGLFARGDHVHPSDTSKQDVLVSGTNIKTINNQSLLGSGNIDIQGGGSVDSTSVPTADKVAEFDSTAHMNSTDMTTSEVSNFVDGLNISPSSTLIDFFYPVGSYYETSDTAFNPNASWGGTWILETEGQVHVSSGTNYSVSGALTNVTDGGEKTHKLTIAEMPSHTHTQNAHTHGISQHSGSGTTNTGWHWELQSSSSGPIYNLNATNNRASSAIQYATATNQNTGGGTAHNVMQPFIVVNRWHRTA